MAWTVTNTYAGANWEIFELTAGAGGDVSTAVSHGLKTAPVGAIIIPLNGQAAASQAYCDTVGPAGVTIKRRHGFPGADFQLHLFTLRHPH